MTHADLDSTIPRRGHDGPAPLSFSQERMFLLDRIMPGVPAYNVPRLARIGARLDEQFVQQALDTIVRRHEILRTRIRLEAGDPVQVVAPDAHVDLTVDDVTALSEDEREPEALRRIAAVAWRPFDVASDVLLRAALVHVNTGEDLLLLVNQHLVSDHAAGAILFAELSETYAALADGRSPELPDLPLQYADYATWQRTHLEGLPLDEMLEYWTTALQGAPQRLELPTDHPRPPERTYRGGTVEVVLETALVQRLREAARATHSTLYVALLTAFKALLHRYSGQSDLVIGTAVSGRHYDEIASLLGYFSNTLPLRTDVGGDPTFRELLMRVRETTLEALAHQELPFERLVEELNPERATATTPIFQVLFAYDVERKQQSSFAGVPMKRLAVPEENWSRFDLSLILREQADGAARGFVEYSSDLFERTTAERLVGHLKVLLAAAADDLDARLSRLPLLTEHERDEMLVDWNSTDAAYPHVTIHELFAQQVARTPDAPAVESGGASLAYGELDRYSNQLAHELQALGVAPGDLVAVCLERGLSLIVALLGVLKSGAAYVPVDPMYPAERQAFMLEDAQVPVVITEAALASSLPDRRATVLCLDSDEPRLRSRLDTPPSGAKDPEQLAYVIYTSGSTGKPKGVEITHRSVVNLLTHMSQAPGLGEGDVVANVTTHAFDLSVPDWYLPLTRGAKLLVVPRDETLDAAALGRLLDAESVTFMQATPTTWQLLVDAGWKGSRNLKIVCGGEALPGALAVELLSRSASLWHMYGPTETTVWSSVLRLESIDHYVPIGGPIANTRLYVLDEHRQLVPIGVPGELYIAGDGLARGYRNRPDLTAERFVVDPFSTEPGCLMYRTGDLARWRDGGLLEFRGRTDFQVKLRGHRIELGEVEAVLAIHPGIAAAVAAVREDMPGDARLVAYVVPADGGAPSDDELRTLARKHLPPYMIPATFVTLDELPLNANGKLDRAALPRPGATTCDPGKEYEAPTTPAEERLAAIWQELLRVDQVGANDNFFDLGGHSLLAMKMLALVQTGFGIDIPLPVVFDRSTVRELADLISTRLLAEADDDDLTSILAEIEAGA